MSERAAAHLTIATAGHIDHGKSTLVEALTGVHPDRLKEERARGISIELGFAHARLGDVDVSFVDVPGHERFVRHMLAGIGGIDALLCVVAADESIMPQTREHLAIARLLGVPRGVVALTKADLVDGDLVDLVTLEVDDLLREHGFHDTPIVPVSARTGQGLDALRDAIGTLTAARDERDVASPARLPVDRAFTMRGFGTVVTGTLWTGRLRPDQDVVVMPEGRRFRVRGLQVHGRPADEAVAGQRVAVNLAQATLEDVARGAVLAEDGGLLVTRRLDAHLDVLGDAPPLRHGARVHLHVGTAAVLARVAVLATSDEAMRDVSPGTRGLVRLRCESALALRRGDRFVLRSYSPVTTVAGGVVLDPAPPRRLSRAAAARRLAALAERHDAAGATAAHTGTDALLSRLVDDAGAAGLVVDELPARLGVAPQVVAAALEAQDRHALVRLADRVVAARALADLTVQVLADVDAHHATDPLSDGLPRQSLRERRGRRAPLEVVEHVVNGLLADGTLVVDHDRLARPAQRQSRAAEGQARATMLAKAEAAGLQAATLEELVGASGVAPAQAEAVLRHLVRDEAIAKLGTLYVARAALRQVVDDLRRRLADGEGRTVDVGWFKERYGVTRRTAIPLLEWLDRQRVTRRVGDTREIVAP